MPVPLLRAAGGTHAAVLPDPFSGLANSKYRVRFRKGQLCMLAGPPGAGKTMFALIAALRMGIPGLYVSADSDEWTMAARAAAAITKHPVPTIEGVMKNGLYVDEYGPAVADIQLRFVFEPSEPDVADIAHALTAWLEVQGDPPDLIVVDNLLNMRTDDANEWTAMRQVCKDLHWLARKSGACVWVLHHTSEQDHNHVTKAPPRSAIQGKVSQLPALILTTAYDPLTGEQWVAVVKHRHGPQDPHARDPLRWVADFTRCQIFDTPMEGSVINGYRYGQEGHDQEGQFYAWYA